VVAEAPTLIAPTEELQVPQTEEPSSPPAPESEENPPEQQAEESDAEPTLESVHDEFLKKIGAGEDVTDTSEPGAKPLSPEAQAELERVLQERDEETQRLTRETGILNTFRDNATTLRTWAANKLQPGDTEALVAFFRDYHGISGQIHKGEAVAQETTRQVTEYSTAMAKALKLPPAKSQEFVSELMKPDMNQAKAAEAVVARAREGYVSKQELTKAKAEAVNEYKAFLIEKKLLKGHDAPPAENSSGVASSSDEAKLADPNTPVSELIAIRERQKRAGG